MRNIFEASYIIGRRVRAYMVSKYGISELEGRCKEAADIIIQELSKLGIQSSKHFGWCIYDSCETCTGEPCAPHCYVLVHEGTYRYYLDVTATQFETMLEDVIPEVILLPSGQRPYWFRAKKPSIREMERVAGY